MSVHIGDAADTALWRGRFAIRAAATGFPTPGTSFSANPTAASRPTLSIQRTSLAREGSLFSSGALALSPCERILGFALNPLLDASGSAIGLLPLRNPKPYEATTSSSGPAALSLFSACEPDASQRWVNGVTDPWSGDGGGAAASGGHDDEGVEGYDVCEIEGDISQQLSWIECPAGISPASIAWCGVPVGGAEDDDDDNDGHNISSSHQQQQQLVLLGTTQSSIHIGSIPAELYDYLTSISTDDSGSTSEGVSVPFELLGSLTTGTSPNAHSIGGGGGGGGGGVVSSLVPLRSATFDSPMSSMGAPFLVAGVCGDAVHIWDLCGDETPAYSLPAHHRNNSSSSSSPNSAYLHNSAHQPQSATAASWASAASPSGQVIAVGGSSGSLLLYDCRGGGCMVLDGYNNQVLRHHPGRLGAVSSIDFSPIVPWAVAVASQASSVAHVYDVRFPCAPVASLCASGGGRGFGGMGQLRHPQGGVSSLQWMPQRADLLCSSSSDGVVRVWTCRASLSDTSQWENAATASSHNNNNSSGSWGDDGDEEQEAAHYNGTSLQLVGSARVSTSQLAGSQSQWLASSTSFSSSAVVSTAISQSAPRGNLMYALSAEGTLASIEIPCSTLRHVAPESLLAADTERERRRHADQEQGLGSISSPSTAGTTRSNAVAADPMFADEAATQRMIRDERIVEGQLNERSLPETARGIIKCAQRRVARGHLMMALDICSLLQKAELLRPTTTTAANCGNISKSAWTELGDVMWPGSRSSGDNPTTTSSRQQEQQNSSPPSAFCIQRLIAYFTVKALSKASKTPSRITRIEVMTRAYMAQQRLLVRELAALSERIPATIRVCEWDAGAVVLSSSSTPQSGGGGNNEGGVPSLGNLPPSVGLPHREMLARVSALRLNIRIGMHVRANTLLSTLLKPHPSATATISSTTTADGSSATSATALAAMRVIEDALRCRPDFVEEATVCEIVRAMKNAAITEVYSSARSRFTTSNTKSNNTATSSSSPVHQVTFDDVYAFIVLVVEELLGWKPDAYTQEGGGGNGGDDGDGDDESDDDGGGFGVERVPSLNSIQFSSTAARSRFGDGVAPASQSRRSTTKAKQQKGASDGEDGEDGGDEPSDSLDDMMNDLDDDDDENHSDKGHEEPETTTVMSPTVISQNKKNVKKKATKRGKGRHTAPSDTLTPSQISKIRTKAANLAKAVVLAALEPLLSDNTSISTGKLRRLHRSFLNCFSQGGRVGGAPVSIDSDAVRVVLSSIKSQLRVAQSFHELRGLQVGLREALDNHKDRGGGSASKSGIVPTSTATENRQVSLYRQRLKMVSSNIITLVTKYQRSSLEEHQAFSRRGDGGGGGDQRVGVFGWLGETPICTYLKALLTQNQHVPFFWSCQQFLDAHRRFLPRKRASSSNEMEGDGRAHMYNYTTKAHFSKGLRKLAAKTKSVGASAAASVGVVKDVPVLCHQVESMALHEILRLDAAADAVVATVATIVGTSSPTATSKQHGGARQSVASSSKAQLSSIIPTSREEKLERVTGVLVREVHPYILTVSSIIGEIKTVGMHSGALEMPPLIERTLEVLSDIVMRVCGAWSQVVEVAEGILTALKESGGLPATKPSLTIRKGGRAIEDRRSVTEDEASTHPNQSLASRQKDTAVTSIFLELRTFLTDIQTLVEGCMGLGDFEPLALVADDVARVLEEFEM